MRRCSQTGLCLALLVLAACRREGEAVLATVTRGPLVEHHLLTGELEAERADRLTVPVTEVWQLKIHWLAEDGERVAAGAPVAEFDDAEVQNQLTNAEGVVETARDELAQQQATEERSLVGRAFTLSQAEAELHRAEVDAAVPEGILSARDYLDRQLAVTRARAARDRAAAELRGERSTAHRDVGLQSVAVARAGADVGRGRGELAALRLLAPHDGVVEIGSHPWEGRKFQLGDQVYPGFPVATLPDLASLRVIAKLSDVDDGRVRAGMPARCVLDAFPDDPVACTVTEVAPIAQESDRRSFQRAFRVVVALARVDTEHLRPGMSVRVEVETARHDDALLLARGAIAWRAEQAVARRPDGRLAELALGGCDAQRCAVVGGLAEGDRLLLADAPALTGSDAP